MELMQFTNIEAEQAILGLLIMHNDALQKVSDILKVDHFATESHQKIYDEILKKVNQEGVLADYVTMAPFFKTLPEGFEYLNHLANCTHWHSTRDYALSLIQLSEKRKLVAGFHEMIVLLETKTTSDVVAKTQDLISSVDSESSEVEIFDGEQMEQSLLDGWKDGSSNIIIPTGINKLDVMLNGGFTVDKLYKWSERTSLPDSWQVSAQ